MQMPSRRLKQYCFDPEYIMDVLARFGQHAPRFVEVRNLDLPEDAKVLEIKYDVWYRAFLILIESSSFDEVPLGEIVPSVATNSSVSVYQIAQPKAV